MSEAYEPSYALVDRVAALLRRGLSKNEVFLRLVARGFDPAAASEFVDYVVKATRPRPTRMAIARRAARA
jgi:hypothetical protein